MRNSRKPDYRSLFSADRQIGNAMSWWIAMVVCICVALIIQYLCSSKILRVKQQISIKSLALRDAREEGVRLEELAVNLTNEQKSLTHSVERLRADIKRVRHQIESKGIPLPEPDFDLSELEVKPSNK